MIKKYFVIIKKFKQHERERKREGEQKQVMKNQHGDKQGEEDFMNFHSPIYCSQFGNKIINDAYGRMEITAAALDQARSHAFLC
jgi:hypothetical protein